MTRWLSSLLILLILAVSAPLPVAAQDSDQPSGAIDVEDSATRDAAIAVRIRSILDELEGYDDVTVTVSSGIVTLRGTTLDAATAARLNGLIARVQGVVAIENEVVETTDVVRRLNPALERFENRAWQVISFLPLLLIALTVFLVVAFIGWLVTRSRGPWDRLAPNAFIANIYRQLVWLAFLVGGLVIALDVLNATALLGTILGAAGIIGLAIGFAVRDTVENYIASIMLSIRQPFRPNDAIEINGDEGKVIRLTSRATILLSWDGNHIRIPNATVFKSRIVNYSRNPERRILFDLGVAYGTDLAAAQKLAEDTVRALPFILEEPAVSVWIAELGGSAVNIRVAGWIDQTTTSLLAARSEAIRLSLAAFDAAGIEMPEPTYRVIPTGGGFAGMTEEDSTAKRPAEPPFAARPEAAPAAPPVPGPAAPVAPVQDVEVKTEQSLEAMVDAERKVKQEDDLLTTDAPEE